MIELTEWAASRPFDDRPWMIVGKGPSFARRSEIDLEEYNVATLNHVVDHVRPEIAHMADLDVVASCTPRLRELSPWLVMPRRPHVANRPSGRLLEDHFDELPVLAELDRLGRLVWYNLGTGEPVGDSPVFDVFHFSSEPVLGIVAELGATTVRTLGIDGGGSYSPDFASLEDSTLLSNDRPNFDVQFFHLESIARRRGLDLAPAVPPMQVFVGCSEREVVPARVLAHTIRSHAGQPVDVRLMHDVTTPTPRDEANRPRVPFSFTRFAIPALAGHEGRALYLDSDMLVFDDISELWSIPFDGHAVLCTTQPEPPAAWVDNPDFRPGRHTAVLLLDCSRLDWDLDDVVAGLDRGEYDYDTLVKELGIVPDDLVGDDAIPVEWNHLEHHDPATTKLLHYTVVHNQPWTSDDNPLGHLWEAAFASAVAAGAVPEVEIERSVRKGWIKASLADVFGEPSVDVPADLVAARYHIAKLEHELFMAKRRLGQLERSVALRVGQRIVGVAKGLRRAVRRGATHPTGGEQR